MQHAAAAAAFRLLNLQKRSKERRCHAAQADSRLEELAVNYICYIHTDTRKLANYLTLRMPLRPEKFTLSSSQPVPSVSWLRELYYGLSLGVCV